MSSARQLDLFQNDEPSDSSDEEHQGPIYWADPDEVREELHQLLATLREAQTLPWTADRVKFWKVVFPSMTSWLHPKEAAQLCSEFEAEMARLEAVEV